MMMIVSKAKGVKTKIDEQAQKVALIDRITEVGTFTTELCKQNLQEKNTLKAPIGGLPQAWDMSYDFNESITLLNETIKLIFIDPKIVDALCNKDLYPNSASQAAMLLYTSRTRKISFGYPNNCVFSRTPK
eukprot:c25451_g1_i1 orf=325-717(+)